MPTSPANDEPPAATEPAEVVALREELTRAQDRHRRALADLDNYRKRTEREGDRRVAEAQRVLLREWLEAVDSVERALQMEPGDPGLTAVLEQMEAILARHGVVRLDAVGTRFDPERHEAIAVQPATAGVPDQTVLEVARSGFGLGDGDILRPAQVVVARGAAGER
jgi:molecular chaperone GrpE